MFLTRRMGRGGDESRAIHDANCDAKEDAHGGGGRGAVDGGREGLGPLQRNSAICLN